MFFNFEKRFYSIKLWKIFLFQRRKKIAKTILFSAVFWKLACNILRWTGLWCLDLRAGNNGESEKEAAFFQQNKTKFSIS